MPLFQRRSVWLPTPLGWALLLAGLIAPLVLWWFRGERFFALTEKLPAEALVVEGWLGYEAFRAAKVEFESGGYRYLITSGGFHRNNWGPERWNYAEQSARYLRYQGVPPDQIIEARAGESGSQRTRESALAVRRELQARGIHLKAVNVFTLGAHARRSRLIYDKVLPAGTEVGVIAWYPADQNPAEPWWRSTERAEALIKETVGYAYELLLNSGRFGSTPTANLEPSKEVNR
jgi:uncharacterized SAM-binding protein YcdF (DUF218 family)